MNNKWVERGVLGVAALVIGLALGWAIRGVATYRTDTQTVTTFGDWRAACPPASAKDQNCSLIEQIMDTRTGQSIVQLGVATTKGKTTLSVNVPLGVLLPAGAGLVLGTDPPKIFAYRTCTQSGCIADVVLDDKTLAALNTAKDGKVLVAGMDQKAVAIPISLKGYSDAARAVRTAEQRRSSWFWRMFS
jgi:invasion protein IalB